MDSGDSCGGKICYTEKNARQIINDCKKYSHFSQAKRIPRRFYYCDRCGWVHLTSQKVGEHNDKARERRGRK